MRIVIATDHRGFVLKQAIMQHYQRLIALIAENIASAHPELVEGHDQGFDLIDVGAFSAERSDYPVFAQAVCKKIRHGEADLGILLCGSGGGIAIAANRFRGIYAVPVLSEKLARAAREHDHCNVLVLPADYLDAAQAIACIDAWLLAKPREGRYAERLHMLDAPDFTTV